MRSLLLCMLAVCAATRVARHKAARGAGASTKLIPRTIGWGPGPEGGWPGDVDTLPAARTTSTGASSDSKHSSAGASSTTSPAPASAQGSTTSSSGVVTDPDHSTTSVSTDTSAPPVGPSARAASTSTSTSGSSSNNSSTISSVKPAPTHSGLVTDTTPATTPSAPSSHIDSASEGTNHVGTGAIAGIVVAALALPAAIGAALIARARRKGAACQAAALTALPFVDGRRGWGQTQSSARASTAADSLVDVRALGSPVFAPSSTSVQVVPRLSGEKVASADDDECVWSDEAMVETVVHGPTGPARALEPSLLGASACDADAHSELPPPTYSEPPAYSKMRA